MSSEIEAGISPPATRSYCKVAYLVSRFPKLTETFVLYELIALDSMGVALEFYPLLRERQRVAHPEVEQWTSRARFRPFLSCSILGAHFRFIRCAPRAYFGVLAEVLRGAWGSLNFFLGVLAFFPKAVRIAYEMERDQVTHVHAHFCTHPALVALIIHRLTGIPFSFTAHGSDLHVDRRMLDVKLDAAAFGVAVSDYNRRLMIDTCGITVRSKIHVIHCGVDVEAFLPRRDVPEHRPFRLICVASFEEVKGHRYLVAACALLRRRGIHFVCDLVGDGPQRRTIERQIAELQLADQVRILGGTPRPEVIRMLRESDAAVLASCPTKEGKREGIPVVLMEAMATGLPVVSTTISGIPELVTSEVTGILVPPGDPSSIADALERLANDAGLRERLGAAGRAKVERDFNQRVNTAALLHLFHAATAEGKGVQALPSRIGSPSEDPSARTEHAPVENLS